MSVPHCNRAIGRSCFRQECRTLQTILMQRSVVHMNRHFPTWSMSLINFWAIKVVDLTVWFFFPAVVFWGDHLLTSSVIMPKTISNIDLSIFYVFCSVFKMLSITKRIVILFSFSRT